MASNPTAAQVNHRHSLGVCIALLSGYLFFTACLVLLLEPGLTPPGFTGRGGWAMPLLVFGATSRTRRHSCRRRTRANCLSTRLGL